MQETLFGDTEPNHQLLSVRPFRHSFDGLTMLHQFSLRGGTVAYANRFRKSWANTAVRETGRIEFPEFATDPCCTVFRRIKALFVSERLLPRFERGGSVLWIFDELRPCLANVGRHLPGRANIATGQG